MEPIGIAAAMVVAVRSSFNPSGRFVMHHLLAWRESIADIVAEDIAPVPDSIWAIQNNHFMPTVDWSLQFAYFGAAGATRARFITPSFRQVTSPWIRPIQLSIVPGDEPNVADYRGNPLTFRRLEEIQLEGYQTTGGAAVVVGLAGVSKGGLVPAPAGDIFSMRGTGATTLTAGAWSLVTVTWQDTLPVGKYAVVGFEYVGTTALAARLIFEELVERPGCIGSALVSQSGDKMFKKGGMGRWGTFDANRMPNVECLANAADTAQEFYLDIIKIG